MLTFVDNEKLRAAAFKALGNEFLETLNNDEHELIKFLDKVGFRKDYDEWYLTTDAPLGLSTLSNSFSLLITLLVTRKWVKEFLERVVDCRTVVTPGAYRFHHIHKLPDVMWSMLDKESELTHTDVAYLMDVGHWELLANNPNCVLTADDGLFLCRNISKHVRQRNIRAVDGLDTALSLLNRVPWPQNTKRVLRAVQKEHHDDNQRLGLVLACMWAQRAEAVFEPVIGYDPPTAEELITMCCTLPAEYVRAVLPVVDTAVVERVAALHSTLLALPPPEVLERRRKLEEEVWEDLCRSFESTDL